MFKRKFLTPLICYEREDGYLVLKGGSFSIQKLHLTTNLKSLVITDSVIITQHTAKFRTNCFRNLAP
jgi:hypothetical protein